MAFRAVFSSASLCWQMARAWSPRYAHHYRLRPSRNGLQTGLLHRVLHGYHHLLRHDINATRVQRKNQIHVCFVSCGVLRPHAEHYTTVWARNHFLRRKYHNGNSKGRIFHLMLYHPGLIIRYITIRSINDFVAQL